LHAQRYADPARGARAGLQLLAAVAAGLMLLLLLLLLTLLQPAAAAGPTWSRQMVAGADQVCFPPPPSHGGGAEVCVTRLKDGTARHAGHYCSGRPFCARLPQEAICKGLGMQVSIDTIRTSSFSPFSSVQNCTPNLVCCVQEGGDGTFRRSEEIETLIATGTSRRTAGISECPPSLAQLVVLPCLSVYAEGCVFVAEGCWRSWDSCRA